MVTLLPWTAFVHVNILLDTRQANTANLNFMQNVVFFCSFKKGEATLRDIDTAMKLGAGK